MLGCVPREGIHSLRLFDFAVVDIIITVVAGLLASKALGVPRWASISALFVAGVVAHKALGIDTKLNTLLFGRY